MSTLSFFDGGTGKVTAAGCDFVGAVSLTWTPVDGGLLVGGTNLVSLDGGALDVSMSFSVMNPGGIYLPGALCYLGPCDAGSWMACTNPPQF